MKPLLVIVLSLATLQVAQAQENILHFKSCQVRLSQEWMISNHVPNGQEISLVMVILTDSTGQPPADKSMLIYGFCDVSTHAGLTMKQSITDTLTPKAVKQIGDWEVSYRVEAKRTDFGLAIDAFRYVPDRKAYLWVRKGRMVNTADYTPTEEDYREFATYLTRITEVRAP